MAVQRSCRAQADEALAAAGSRMLGSGRQQKPALPAAPRAHADEALAAAGGPCACLGQQHGSPSRPLYRARQMARRPLLLGACCAWQGRQQGPTPAAAPPCVHAGEALAVAGSPRSGCRPQGTVSVTRTPTLPRAHPLPAFAPADAARPPAEPPAPARNRQRGVFERV